MQRNQLSSGSSEDRRLMHLSGFSWSHHRHNTHDNWSSTSTGKHPIFTPNKTKSTQHWKRSNIYSKQRRSKYPPSPHSAFKLFPQNSTSWLSLHVSITKEVKKDLLIWKTFFNNYDCLTPFQTTNIQ